jgi:PKD repeat protein
MISVLRNQNVRRRKGRACLRPIPMTYARKQRVIPHTFYSSSRRRKSTGFNASMLKYPLLGVLILLLVFLFLSSPHIFSLTFSGFSENKLNLPKESSLNGYSDEYDYVENMHDERESTIISIGLKNRGKASIPSLYILREGDTIYSISKKYDLSFYDLLKLNRITDPKNLKVGDMIHLLPETDSYPALPEEGDDTDIGCLPEEITIRAKKKEGYAPLTANFSVTTPIPDESLTYMWVLGNDRYAFEKNPIHMYTTPGRFDVFLIASDKNHHEVVSNKISIEVIPKTPKKVRIESHTPRFVTVNEINNIIDISEIYGGKDSFQNKNLSLIQTPEILQHLGENKFLTTRGGYSKIIAQTDKEKYTTYLFVSPFPSKHSYEPSYNWYKTQFATGVNGNCGPACVAMAIHWAAAHDIPVEKVRAEIGMPYRNGSISYANMVTSFKKHRVTAYVKKVSKTDDMCRIIDRGNLAIVVFYTGKISKTKGNKSDNMVGRYYEDETGHYVIVKGYTLDKKYFIVYDPIPSDWKNNKDRYADGTSMLGKNRYYSCSELMKAIRREVLEVSR